MLEPFVGIDAAIAIEVGGEVAVSHDDGGRELSGEALEEGAHALALGFGAGVAGIAGSIETAFIADADGVLVVAFAVGAYLPEGTALVDLTVAGDVVMIADVFPTALEVVGFALVEGVALRGLRAAAVQDDEGYCSHCSCCFWPSRITSICT